MNNPTDIQQIWKVELEILDVIHQICMDHGLRYSLAYGTLIGAMRHGGFIPWDDDIDLIMPRQDYEQLLSIWEKTAPKGYILQNIRTNPDYTNTFSKIRKDRTTFLQDRSEECKQYHKGIFVDIFPADRVAGNKISRSFQYLACAINLLFTRGYKSDTGGIIKIVESILLILPKAFHPALRKASEKIIRSWNDQPQLRWFSPSTIEYATHYYPANLFDDPTTIQFCEKHYCCVADPDGFLRADYGDYMHLPPENERVWKHHPVLIDFEHNFEELNLQI